MKVAANFGITTGTTTVGTFRNPFESIAAGRLRLREVCHVLEHDGWPKGLKVFFKMFFYLKNKQFFSSERCTHGRRIRIQSGCSTSGGSCGAYPWLKSYINLFFFNMR